MDKIIKPGKALVGFGANAMGTAALEIGPRYHGLLLVGIATAAAGQTLTLADFFGLITVKEATKPQKIHLATELDALQSRWNGEGVYGAQIYNYDTGVINYVNGIPQAAQAGKQTICFMPIWFAEPWRKTWGGAEQFAWYTSWADGSSLASFELEVTGGPTTNLLAGSNITASMYVEYDAAVGPLDANKKPVNLISKWQRNPQQYSAAGDQQITSLPKKDSYLEIVIFCQAGDDINRVQCLVNSKVVRDVTKGVNDVTLLNRGVLPAKQSVDRFDLVFDHSDKPSDGLVLGSNGKTVQDFTFIATLNNATAGTKLFYIASNRYGPPD